MNAIKDKKVMELIKKRAYIHKMAVKSENEGFYRTRDYYKNEYNKLDKQIEKLVNG